MNIMFCIGIFLILLLMIYNLNLKRQYQKFLDMQSAFFKDKEFFEVSKKTLELWLRKKIEGKDFGAYFAKNGIKKVGIYGMSQTGFLIYKELEKTGTQVTCLIDRSEKTCGLHIPVCKPDAVQLKDFQNEVDAIVVAPVYYFSEIYDFLNGRLENQVLILGIDEILCEL